MTVTRRGGPQAARDGNRHPTRAIAFERLLIWNASMIATKPISVAGAGSIGCFVGGVLADAGRRVSLLARARVIGEIDANGLRVTSFEGLDHRVASGQLLLSDD